MEISFRFMLRIGELDEALSLSMEALQKFPDEARAHGHVGSRAVYRRPPDPG